MAADLWGWFYQVRSEAYRANNRPVIQSIELHYQGWECRERDPQKALNLWQQSKNLAVQGGNPCLALFSEYWCCEAYLFYLFDVKAGLDAAVRMIVEARKPQYAMCPVLARAYRVLLEAYLATDPFGYAVQVFDTIRYIQQHLSMDDDTEQLLVGRQVVLSIAFEEYEEALEICYKYLEVSEGISFRLSHAYTMLCEMTAFLGDFDAAYEHALAAEQQARMRRDTRAILAEALAWQAFLVLKKGDAKKAARLEQEALNTMSALNVKTADSYYRARCLYAELQGNLELALKIRRHELSEIMNTGQLYAEFYCRAQICRLLVLMGLPVQKEEAAARQAMSLLLDTSFPEKKLKDALEGSMILHIVPV